MPAEEFERHRAALMSNKLTRDTALGQEGDRAWDAIWAGRDDFLAREQEAQVGRALRWRRRGGAPPLRTRALRAPPSHSGRPIHAARPLLTDASSLTRLPARAATLLPRPGAVQRDAAGGPGAV
jgi:hypothetical protein